MIKWLIELTQKKPLLGLLAALLIGISVMGSVCLRLYNVNQEQEKTIIDNERFYRRTSEIKDSLHRVEVLRIQDKANLEVHDYLVKANDEMSARIKELQSLNDQRTIIYSNNKKVLNNNRTIIKKLRDGK